MIEPHLAAHCFGCAGDRQGALSAHPRTRCVIARARRSEIEQAGNRSSRGLVQHRRSVVAHLQIERKILARHPGFVLGANSLQPPVAKAEVKAVPASIRWVAGGARLFCVQLLVLMVEQRAVKCRMGKAALAHEGGKVKGIVLAGFGLQMAAVIPPLGKVFVRGIVCRQLDGWHLVGPGG